ncbi:MAG: hypothetical protein KC593_18755 [Myxococcales bacterium]|nr:hypothetical protein [Myxococcales bacterium]MCB9630394.1 hypothetical protein [Sandaracinaceae bacterium]
MLATVTLSACADDPRPHSHFFGDTALLAADEDGDVAYERAWQDGNRELAVVVLAGDVEASLGFRSLFNPFGSASVSVVNLSAAPTGHQVTLELRNRTGPLDQLLVAYVEEGPAGMRSSPPVPDVTASEDPLGAVCVLEGANLVTLLVRRATDGRVLDSVFPLDTQEGVGGLSVEPFPVAFEGGVLAASFMAPAAGLYEVVLNSSSAGRTWAAVVRVVSEAELVTLDLRTPTEHGLPADSFIAVLRTDDGCPVLGPQVIVETGGVQSEHPSGWDSVYGTGASPGSELRVRWGRLTASAVF